MDRWWIESDDRPVSVVCAVYTYACIQVCAPCMYMFEKRTSGPLLYRSPYSLEQVSLNLELGRRSTRHNSPPVSAATALWLQPYIATPSDVICLKINTYRSPDKVPSIVLSDGALTHKVKWGREQFTVNGVLMSNWSHWDIPMSTCREELQGFLPLLRGQSKRTPCSLSLRWCLPFIPHCPNSLGLWADGIFQTCVEG